MNTVALTFTCTRDAERAAYHQRFLPADWRKVWCVESKDADACRRAAPPGTEILVRDFPRGGTLRGNDAVEGMRKVFLEIPDLFPCDCLVKIDSDTALLRPEAFSAPVEFAYSDFVYIRRLSVESRLLANGCCYAMSRKALARLAGGFPASAFPKNFGGHEDLVFSAFFTIRHKDLALCQISKLRWSWCETPTIAPGVVGAHNGYVSFEKDKAICEALRACMVE